MKQILTRLGAVLTALAGACSLFTMPVLAALTDNPNTSDPSRNIIGVVIAAFIISAVLIVVYLVMNAKNKKKGPGAKKGATGRKPGPKK